MANANHWREQWRSIFQNRVDYFQQKLVNITHIFLHDDVQLLEQCKESLMPTTGMNKSGFFFNNVDDVEECIIEEVSSNPTTTVLVQVIGPFVVDLLRSSIRHCEQLKLIFVLNQPPFDEEERTLAKECGKVKYMMDFSEEQLKKFNSSFHTVFSLEFTLEGQIEESSFLDRVLNPEEQSTGLVTMDMPTRVYLSIGLQKIPRHSTEMDHFVEFLQKKNLAVEKRIQTFRDEYTPNKAVHSYSRYGFIFENLNTALRKANIIELLPYSFLVRDICNELRELMNEQRTEQILTLYRGQRTSLLELLQSIIAWSTNSPIFTTPFFSASKVRDCALGFMKNVGLDDLLNFYSPLILYKITVRKEDASFYFPFADISSRSQYPHEQEVLFSPGLMFRITNIETLIENDMLIYQCEMTLDGAYKNSCEGLQVLMDDEPHPLVGFGKYLTDRGRFDEAKELYTRLQTITNDPETKYFYEIMLCGTEMKRTRLQTPESNSDLISSMPEEWRNFAEEVFSLPSPTTTISFDDMRNSFITGNHSAMQSKATDLTFRLAEMLMQNKQYDPAILLFRQLLNMSLPSFEFGRRFLNQSFDVDPSLKQKCYSRLGKCYGFKQDYEQAFVNYQLALAEETQLPLEDYVEVLLGLGAVFIDRKDYLEALYKLIEISEILNENPNFPNRDRWASHTERFTESVLSQLIDLD